MVSNPLPASVAISVSVAVSVAVSSPFTFAFAFALAFALALALALLLPLSFFLSLFFSLRLSCSSLGLPLLLFGAFFPLGDFSALTCDFFFHSLQIGVFLVTLGPSGTDLGSVVLVCLCAVDTFFLRGIFTDLSLSKFANLLFDGADVDKAFEKGLSLSVDARSVESSVNKGDSFTAVERQQLSWVSLDFLLGDFEDSFCDLPPLILQRTFSSATVLS